MRGRMRNQGRIMKKTIIASLIGLSFTPVAAQSQEIPETSGVVVTASRLPQSRDSVLADVTVIDHEEIQKAGQSTLVELLARQPGIEYSATGGAGKQSSIFIRGTNSDHVIVLVDGLRVNSATTGSFSFESLPISQIERIEILRGPAASLYGADAIGGVIHIFTHPANGESRLSANVGYGRYDTKRASAGISTSQDRWRYSLNVSSLSTDSFSAQRVKSGVDKDHDPYRNLSVNASAGYELALGHDLQLQFLNSEGESDYDCGRQICNVDQTLLSYGLTSRNRFTDQWQSTLRWGIGIDDSTDLTSTRRTVLRTEQRQFSWQNDITLPLGVLSLTYDRLEQDVSGNPSNSVYAVTSRDNNGWLAGYLLDYGPHTVQANLRLDDNSQYDTHTTGNLAYGFRFAPNWRISAGYGTAFKAPSFNQLYFPGFGNENLDPEESRNLETSLRYQSNTVQASITAFRNKVSDLIVFGATMPLNIDNAELKGITMEAAWKMDVWTVRGNATLQSPEDEESGNLLPRRARSYGTFAIERSLGDVQLSAEVVTSGQRYNDPENQFRLAGYTLFNLMADYRLTSEWSLNARYDNVFNREYTVASTKNAFSPNGPDYETPGANLFVGLRWQPK